MPSLRSEKEYSPLLFKSVQEERILETKSVSQGIVTAIERRQPLHEDRATPGRILEYSSADLQRLLSGLRFRLDCGHRCTVGHNLANNLIIVSLGGVRLETLCHSHY